jgi:Ca2+-transporting ATPase
MQRKPRAKSEPIVNWSMGLGIVIQTITQTGAVLTAFSLGLLWELEHLGIVAPVGMSPISFLLSIDWKSINLESLHTAETMAFITLSLCELFRAYTVRSERASIFTIGVFSNRYMQYAVGLSIALLLFVCIVPPLQHIFDTHFMSGMEWGVVLGLAIIPAISEEITKFFLRMRK